MTEEVRIKEMPSVGGTTSGLVKVLPPLSSEYEDAEAKSRSRMGRQIKVYADKTSIHGIKYILELGRPIAERYAVVECVAC